MTFFINQLTKLGMVIIIMVFATLGTTSIIKLIKKFFPFVDLSQNLFDIRKNDRKNQENTEERK